MLRPRHPAIAAWIAALSLIVAPAAAQQPVAPPKTSPTVGADDLPPPAAIAEPLAEEKAQAQLLFDQAKSHHEAGRYADACPLFAESQRLDAGLGTLLYLSDCYELVGKTASAWAGFREAAALAQARKETDRERIARDRAAALESKIPMLRVNVAEPNLTIGLTVRRNNVLVGEPIWGAWVPVDPGPQVLEASAEGYRPWRSTVDIEGGASREEIFVPPLEADTAAPPPPRAKDPTGDVMRISGLALAGVGAVGIGLGAAFGIDAIATYSAARDTCADDDPTRCTREGVSLQSDASDSALVSTVAFSVGAAALAGGAVLFFLAPQDEPPPVAVAFGPSGFLFTFGGTL